MAADEHRLTLKTPIGVYRRLIVIFSQLLSEPRPGHPLGRERLPYTASLLQHLFEEADRPPIARLAERSHGLFSYLVVMRGLRQLDQQRNAFAIGHGLKSAHRAAFHLEIGIVLDGVLKRPQHLGAGMAIERRDRKSTRLNSSH